MSRILALLFLAACSGSSSSDAEDGAPVETGLGPWTGTGTGNGNGTTDPYPNTSTDGGAERCLLLFGGTDRVLGPDTGLPFGTTPRTLQAWIRTTSRRQQVAASHGRGANESGFAIGTLDGNGFMSLAGTDLLVGDVDLADDQWHHLVGAWDGVTAALMVDGVTDAVGQLTGSTIAGSFTAGNMPEGGGEHLPWVGWLDDVKLFEGARPPDQVAADPEGALLENALRIWWDFEDVPDDAEGSGVTVPDRSGNGLDGTTGGLDDHPRFPACR